MQLLNSFSAVFESGDDDNTLKMKNKRVEIEIPVSTKKITRALQPKEEEMRMKEALF